MGENLVRIIGKMLMKLRIEEGIGQGELVRGLLSVSELSKLENEGREIEWTILAALFERMGKSVDRLEIAVTGEEYRVMHLREMMWRHLAQGELEDAEACMREYGALACAGKSVHRQYLLLMQSLGAYMAATDGAGKHSCAELLREALSVTCLDAEGSDWEKICLCEQEIRLLFVQSYLWLESGETERARKCLSGVERYIDTKVTDEDMKVNLYPLCAWLLGESYWQEGNIAAAYEICRKGKACLAEQGAITVMDRLLALESRCLAQMEETERYKSVEQQREALTFLYRMAEYEPPEKDIFCCMLAHRKDELVLCHELVRELREARGISQEKLSEDICTQETLSRIEGGKRKPNRKNLQKLLDRLESVRGTYYGSVIAEDYHIYEKVHTYKTAQFHKNDANREKILRELETELNLEIPVNRQFLECAWLQRKVELGELEGETAIEELERILRYTMNGYEGVVYRIPYREEFVILNQIAICEKKAGNTETALSIYEQVLRQYQKSKVDMANHALSATLFYRNYAAMLEETGNLEKAEEMAKEGILVSLHCGDGDWAAIILANLSCVYEKRTSPATVELCRACLKNGYELLNLFGCQQRAKEAKKIYTERYMSQSNQPLFVS